ncbi:MAG: alpha/beta hydrolase [Pirellulaceae bacterium]
MERSLWISWSLLASLALGCAQEPPEQIARRPGQEAEATPHGDSHFVVRPLDPVNTSATPAAGFSAVGPTAVDSHPASEPLPLDPPEWQPSPAPPLAEEPWSPEFELAEPGSDMTPVPSPVDAAFNPLRLEVAPPPVLSRSNPLRAMRATQSFSAAPRMAERSTGETPFPTAEAVAPPTFLAGEAPSEPDSPAASFPQTASPASPAPPAGGAAPADTVPRAVFAPEPAPVDPAASYDTIQVFYGTDRQAIEPPLDNLPERISRFLPAAIGALITLSLCLVAAARRKPAMWVLACCGVLVSLALGYQAASGTLTAVRSADRSGPQYTSGRAIGGEVQLGVCDVTIPRTHQVGELESPSILRLEVKADAARHVVLSKTQRLEDERFYELLRERVAASPRKELFIFVHGFNVSFEDAARRTAQIHTDVKFAGAPIFFSWPAHDKFILTYNADAQNVAWSVSHLKQFLLGVTKNSRAESINLIAHSMGNRALTAALKQLHLELRDQAKLFNQVILAAPDIDADEFRHSIAPALTQTAERITLYASSRDEALAASQLVHRGPRAGDAGRGLVVIAGIDTIDVTAIDTSPWGHSYYGSSDPVLRDLGLLLMQSMAPTQRAWLARAELDGLPYWVFQPATASTARVPSGEPR